MTITTMTMTKWRWQNDDVNNDDDKMTMSIMTMTRWRWQQRRPLTRLQKQHNVDGKDDKDDDNNDNGNNANNDYDNDFIENQWLTVWTTETSCSRQQTLSESKTTVEPKPCIQTTSTEHRVQLCLTTNRWRHPRCISWLCSILSHCRHTDHSTSTAQAHMSHTAPICHHRYQPVTVITDITGISLWTAPLQVAWHNFILHVERCHSWL